MVFRKYRPVKQWGKMDTRIFKSILNARNERKMPRFQIPPGVQALGVTVHDPTARGFFSCDSTYKLETSVKHDDSSLKSHPLFNDVRCSLFDGSEPMSDGMAQACVLSKSILQGGLPPQVLDNALHDLDEDKVKDGILHGEKYDPTLNKLPRRFDPVLFWVTHPRVHSTPVVKRCEIILNNLYRQILLAAVRKGAAKAEHFRLDRMEPLSVCIPTTSYSPSPLVLRGQPLLTIQVTKNHPIKPWASPEQVNQISALPMESIHPISPEIDLASDHIYNKVPVLARSKVGSSLSMQAVMLAREQNQKYPWTTEQNAANAILYAFAAAVAEAEKLPGKRDLKSWPVMARSVQLVDGRLDLVAFQLNTLDISEDSAIKNIVWVEKGLRLYKPKPFYEQMTAVEELNIETVAKLSALLFS